VKKAMEKFFKLLVAGLMAFVCAGVGGAYGQQSPDKVWTTLSTDELKLYNFRGFVEGAGAYSVLGLNKSTLTGALERAPKEFSQESKAGESRVTFPTPRGTFLNFRVELSPISETLLGSSDAWVKTYRGFGIEDLTATTRFEIAVDGLHAMVRSAQGTFFIDPANVGKGVSGSQPYLSYFSNNGAPPTSEPEQNNNRFNCIVTSQQMPTSGVAKKEVARPGTERNDILSDKYLRTYRVAIAADSYYVDAVYDQSVPGNKMDQALRAIQRTINRVDEIYESELGIHLTLVKDEEKIIFTDKATDPFHSVNDNAENALPVVQKTIDSKIGNANYDIGHLFATDTAGLAMPQSVCRAGLKAQATTGLARPTGDAFDVNYVAHEIAHQFGASHTFNGTLGLCGGGRRNPSTAFEPGSGSTIMGYTGPGLCDQESLQSDSDDYFHAASLGEIAQYVLNDSSGGGTCAVKREVPNLDIPEVDAGQGFTIPKATPFALAPASVPSHAIKLVWEQYDLGAPGPPDDERPPHSAVRPLFRSRRPSLFGRRYFPAIENLVSPNAAGMFTAEALPELDSTLTFRLTGRNGFGRFNYQDVHIQVDASTGPFRVAPLAGGTAWPRGIKKEIKWDVARSNQKPVECSNVAISILIDGDPSRELILNSSTPNTGSVVVTMPDDAPISSNAVLKVSAVGNIFFSVAPQILQIVPGRATK
jgi:hypothetical protein